MAMEDVTEQFCADPEGFMRKNIIVQRIGDPDPGLIAVKVWADSDSVIGNLSGGRVCAMGKAQPGTAPSLPAYWCPYAQNAMKSAMLGDDALYAFTPTMDGCSIGLGSATGSGAQLLCHVNAASIGSEWSQKGADLTTGRARQAQSQFAQLRQALGAHATVVEPGDYRTDGTGSHSMSSTTFAVHALSRPWKLFTLTYRKIGEKTWFHGGVQAHG